MIKYDVENKLQPAPLMLYGLQWFLVTIPSIIIIGSIVSTLHFTNISQQTLYIQKLFAITGIGLIIQILWGHKLPIVIGPAAVLLIGITAATSSGYNAIYTSIIIGGAFITILAVTKLLSKIEHFFTQRIIVVILALIALTLTPIIINLIFSDGGLLVESFTLAILLVLFLIILNKILRGVWKSIIIFIGIVIGSLIYFVISGELPSKVTTSTVDLSSIFITSLDFDVGTIISFIFCYIALLINELGSIQAVGKALNRKDLKNKVNRGVGVTGFTNMLAGSVGVIGVVDFSLSPGIIMATGNASRFALLPAGVALLFFSLFPDMIWIFTAIPAPVMGIVMLYLMATQLSSAFQTMSGKPIASSFNTAITIALPLMIAILIAFTPDVVIQQIPVMIRPILGNGFVMGVLLVIFLEHIIFKNK